MVPETIIPSTHVIHVNIGLVPIPAKAFWAKFWGLDGANTGVRIVEGFKRLQKESDSKKFLGFQRRLWRHYFVISQMV